MKVITIGRTPENDIVINDVKVSCTHLQIIQDDSGNFSVVDCNSTNGTFVNGQKVQGEIALHIDDKVKIGNTCLPWETYFQPKPCSKRKIWLAVATVLVLLLVGGGITFKIVNDKNQAKIEAQKEEENAVLAARNEANQKAEAQNLQKEVDGLFQKALISQSGEDKKLAEQKQKEADKAKSIAEKTVEAQKRAEQERDSAIMEKNAAEKQSKADSAARVEAEKRAKQAEEAEEDANKKKKELGKERDEAIQETKLTTEFLKVFPKLTNNLLGTNYFKKVCEQLKQTPPKGKDEKEFIVELFDKAKNNDERRKIINAINTVLGLQEKDKAAKAAEKAKSDTTTKK